MTLLSAKSLSRSFGGLLAVDSVDFDLEAGEIRAIIGPNGAGKTTFVSLLSGRIPASEGQILFEGKDISQLPAHARVDRGIAYTFQITSVFGDLSCFDNVALAVQRRLMREGASTGTAQLAAGTRAALERVELDHLAEEKASNLSYGHQRLLEVAMGLGLAPKLLILDEPTQGLSDAEIENFLGLVREVASGATILLIEHNMRVVMDLAQKITVLNYGRVLAEGTPEEIRDNQAVQEAYLGG